MLLIFLFCHAQCPLFLLHSQARKQCLSVVSHKRAVCSKYKSIDSKAFRLFSFVFAFLFFLTSEICFCLFFPLSTFCGFFCLLPTACCKPLLSLIFYCALFLLLNLFLYTFYFPLSTYCRTYSLASPRYAFLTSSFTRSSFPGPSRTTLPVSRT